MLIYDIDGDPGIIKYNIIIYSFVLINNFIYIYYWLLDAHTVLAIGSCKRDQHNPSRCGAAANYGDANIVLAKKQ